MNANCWRNPENRTVTTSNIIYYCDYSGKVLGSVYKDNGLYRAMLGYKFIGEYITQAEAKTALEKQA